MVFKKDRIQGFTGNNREYPRKMAVPKEKPSHISLLNFPRAPGTGNFPVSTTAMSNLDLSIFAASSILTMRTKIEQYARSQKRNRRWPMDDDPDSEVNSVPTGYRNPPAGARFRKGQSGNPAGRPKGSRNRPPPTQGERLRSLMLEEAYRPIKVSEDGEEITMPMAQAVFRSLAEAAAKGEARAQAMFLKIVGTSEEEAAAIEQMLDDAREETARAPIEIRIIDAVDGRPAGTSKAAYPYGGPQQKDK